METLSDERRRHDGPLAKIATDHVHSSIWLPGLLTLKSPETNTSLPKSFICIVQTEPQRNDEAETRTFSPVFCAE